MTQKPEQILFDKLARFCNYRDRCSSEIEQKLNELDAEEPHRSIVIQWLMEGEYFNDKIFARSFASGKFRIKGWGKIKIKSALHSKKLPEYLIEEAISSIDEEEYLDKARQLIERKVSSKKIDHLLRQKVLRSMFQKGYSSTLVLDILYSLQQEAEPRSVRS
ncbi:MAG: RecX family transcriptional regulator [Flavobacteriales bacterium]|nr:RecX family transcriptional regulator [Flavobacteriales bacterium]